MERLTKATEFKVEIVEWASRAGAYGPAVIRKDTGEIANGPWIEGTEIEVMELPYRSQGDCAAASVTTPDGNHHHTFLFA